MTDDNEQALLIGVLLAVAVFYVYAQTDDGAATLDDFSTNVGDAMNKISLLLRAQLRTEEGLSNVAYKDTRGIWTIGRGHTGPEVTAGLSWTDAQIEDAFNRDVQSHEGAVQNALPWITDLDDARQVVLYQMAFQMGLAGLLKFRDTLDAARSGDYARAARGMRASLWAKQTPARALRLAAQMETGEFVT